MCVQRDDDGGSGGERSCRCGRLLAKSPRGGDGRGQAGARGEGTTPPLRASPAIRSIVGVHCSRREGDGEARWAATACVGSVLDKGRGGGIEKRPTPWRGVIPDVRNHVHIASGCDRQRWPPRTRRRHCAAAAVGARARVRGSAGGHRFVGRAHRPGGNTAADGGAANGGRGHRPRKLRRAARQRPWRPRSASRECAMSHPPCPAGLELSARRREARATRVGRSSGATARGHVGRERGWGRGPPASAIPSHSWGTRRRSPASRPCGRGCGRPHEEDDRVTVQVVLISTQTIVCASGPIRSCTTSFI